MSFEKHYLDEHEKDVEYFVVYGKDRDDTPGTYTVFYDKDRTKLVDAKTLLEDGGRRLVLRLPMADIQGYGIYGHDDYSIIGSGSITMEGDAVGVYMGAEEIQGDAGMIDTNVMKFEHNGIDIAYCTLDDRTSSEKYTLYRAYDDLGQPIMTSNPNNLDDPDAVRITMEHNSTDKIYVPRRFNNLNANVSYAVWHKDPNKKAMIDDTPCYVVSMHGTGIGATGAPALVVVYSAYSSIDDHLVKASLSMTELQPFLPTGEGM